MAELYNKIGELEKIHSEVRQQFASHVQEVTANMKELVANREDVQQELRRLQHDNDTLVGKYSEGSRQMQNETIDLPNNMEVIYITTFIENVSNDNNFSLRSSYLASIGYAFNVPAPARGPHCSQSG